MKVNITFEYGNEPVEKIKEIEKKLNIKSEYKGKLKDFHFDIYEYYIAYNNLQRDSAIHIIDVFSKELNDFKSIELMKEEDEFGRRLLKTNKKVIEK